MASADDAWVIHMSSAGGFGARREEGLGREGDNRTRVNCEVTRVDEDGLKAGHAE